MSEALSLTGERLRKSFRRSTFALDVPRVSVGAGETLALLGPSGSGKSTLLHVLGLLLRPDAGRVLLGDRPVGWRDHDARMAMAAVFQRPYLFKGSVGANVAYGLADHGVRKPERPALVAAALERVGLGGFEERSALSLSGGEAQRVSLARALVLQPKVLLVDEPLASLDALLKRRLIHDFATILRESGVTVVYVTHDLDEALVVADRIAIMNEGRIVSCGAAESIVGLAEDEWTASFLGIEPASQGTAIDSGQGLVRIQADGIEVFAAGEVAKGTSLLFSVRPEDILLFEAGAELPATTARNRLPARVTSVEARGATLRIGLQMNGVRLASSVSRAAAGELGLVPGAEVLAVFKASAVRWRVADA